MAEKPITDAGVEVVGQTMAQARNRLQGLASMRKDLQTQIGENTVLQSVSADRHWARCQSAIAGNKVET